MNQTQSRALCILALLFAFMTCTCPTWGSEAMVLTRTDNGREISIPRGSTLEVHLEEPGATGYSWEIVGLDTSHLTLSGEEIRAGADGRMMGRPATKVWYITTIKQGKTELSIVLFRPWEGVEKAADSFRVGIDIH